MYLSFSIVENILCALIIFRTIQRQWALNGKFIIHMCKIHVNHVFTLCREHSGSGFFMYLSIFFNSWLVISITLVCLSSYSWLVSTKCFFSHIALNLIKVGYNMTNVSSFHTMNLCRKSIHRLCLKCLMAKEWTDNRGNISIKIQQLAHCCISSQVFTTHYAINAHDSVKRSCLL